VKLTTKYLLRIGTNHLVSENQKHIQIDLANHHFYFNFQSERIYLEGFENRVRLKIPFTIEALSKIITAFIGEPF
jgi:hypothetical protein